MHETKRLKDSSICDIEGLSEPAACGELLWVRHLRSYLGPWLPGSHAAQLCAAGCCPAAAFGDV